MYNRSYFYFLIKFKKELNANEVKFNKKQLKKAKFVLHCCFSIQMAFLLGSLIFSFVLVVIINDTPSLQPFFTSVIYFIRTNNLLAAGFWLLVPTIIIAGLIFITVFVTTLVLVTTDWALTFLGKKIVYGLPKDSICRKVNPIYFNHFSQHPDWN